MLYKLVLRTILKQIQKFPLGNANQRTENIIEIRRLVLYKPYFSCLFVFITNSRCARVPDSGAEGRRFEPPLIQCFSEYELGSMKADV